MNRIYNEKSSKIVLMGEIAVINSNSAFNALETYGLETSFGLVLHDAKNKVVGLGHVDSYTCAKDGVKKMITDFQINGGSLADVKAELYTGDYSFGFTNSSIIGSEIIKNRNVIV